MAIKTLWIREEYLELILQGRKTVEVRVGYSNIRRLKPGDELLLNGVHRFLIRRVAFYPDFDTLLLDEDAQKIAPDLTGAELMAAFRQIYPAEKEALGVVALEILRT